MQDYHKLKKKSKNDQKTVYDVAIKFNGKVTVSDIYTNSNLTIEQIEFILADLSTKNYVKSHMDETSSVIKYEFPDINNYENKSIMISSGIDKLVLRMKYGSSQDKPTEYLEKAILQTAQEFNGKLSMLNIIEYTNLSVDDALDVISILCAKGFCKREIDNSEDGTISFYFPDLFKDKIKEEIQSFTKNLSRNTLERIRKSTDKMLIKGKVNKYKRKYKSSLILDSFSSGLGHVMDKRWSFYDFLLFSTLPFILTGGLSFIILVPFLRYQDAVYYSLSERDKRIKITSTNRSSLAYFLLYSFIYYKSIGLTGLANYYLYLFNFLSF